MVRYSGCLFKALAVPAASVPMSLLALPSVTGPLL
jgi:hypothetical protein